MKVIAKIGSQIKELDDLPATLIRKKMEGVMKEHPHLCADCVSTACGHKRGIYSPVVYSGIRTLQRDYIFKCLAYQKKKVGEGYDRPKTGHHTVPYEPVTHQFTDEDVKRFVMRMR